MNSFLFCFVILLLARCRYPITRIIIKKKRKKRRKYQRKLNRINEFSLKSKISWGFFFPELVCVRETVSEQLDFSQTRALQFFCLSDDSVQTIFVHFISFFFNIPHLKIWKFSGLFCMVFGSRVNIVLFLYHFFFGFAVCSVHCAPLSSATDFSIVFLFLSLR